MLQFAARLGDDVVHPIPPKLTGGPCSPNVVIGGQHAWLAIDPADLVALMRTIEEAKVAVLKAETATAIAKEKSPGTAAVGIAEANEVKVKAEQCEKIASAIGSLASKGVSIHACVSLLPAPAPGIVVTGSTTVKINGLPACRVGDTILEGLLHAPNLIKGGCPTVIVGG
jgi:uncharacterized Zn-binding protein involved in type VI secretion